MHNYLFYILIILPIAGFIIARLLSWLNSKMWSPVLPEKLKGICNDDEYARSMHYQKDNDKLALWSGLFNLAVIVTMILFGGFAFVNEIAIGLSGNNIVIALVFFGIIGVASDIINIPFSVYDSFVIEKKYGFNTMSPRTFITDHIKTWFLAVLIGGPVLVLITWLYYKLGSSFWVLAWICITVFSVIINLFYSELIVPLFNKQVPLAEGSLRDKIQAFGNKADFRIKNIYVIDGSRRSTKANAYFAGFGPRKRIVLYDTLIKEMTEDEIVAVLAHEIGHYRKKHVLKSLVASVFTTGLMLFLFSRVVSNPELSGAIGVQSPFFHTGLVVFGILYSPLSLIIGLISNAISRKHEFEADRFAALNSDKSALADSLKKLSVKNLSNMLPHPAYVFFYYSHPPLLRRLEKLE